MTRTTVPLYVVWVCVDCLFAREGDAPESPDREPWNLLAGEDVTHGLLLGESDCECDPETGDPCSEEHSECQRREFSWQACGACGSTLGGEREAYTVWGPADS